VSATGNITGGNISTAGRINSGSLSLSGNVTSALNVTGNVTASNIAAATLSLSGNVTSALNVTGNVTAANMSTSGISAATLSLSGNVTSALNVTGNVTANNVAAVGTILGASASLTGNIIANSASVGAIIKTGANTVGNIGQIDNAFNTVFARATSAQYADLAEMYCADANYPPGTVLSFGGSQEVTISSVASDARVAGVVSTHPAYLMNSTLKCDCAAVVALTGRVPALVTGTVRKGDMMVSAGNGRAQACATPAMGTVIGKAVEDFEGATGTIEIVVGRL
jgi:hypothetical protein